MNTYKTLLRPASTFTLPRGVRWEFVEAPFEGVNRPDLPRSQHRYGVISTDRPLTQEEQSHFDIVAV